MKIACSLTIFSLAIGIVPLPARTAPLTGDGGVAPFYSWKMAIPPPGRLLRQEPIPTDKRPYEASSGVRILYSSSTDFGTERPITVSGILLLPKGRAPKGGWPVIALAHGTVGTADRCAPSWTGYRGSDRDVMARWLAVGYAIVATDYEGLGTPGAHPYMALTSAARTILDSVRATRHHFPLSAKTVIIGQSQGAHAAFGAGLLQPRYAPDVDVRAVVATGLPGEGGFAPLDNDRDNGIARARPVDPATIRNPVRRLDMARFDPWFVVFLNYFPSYAQVVPGFDPAQWLTADGMAMLADLDQGCASSRVAALFKDRPTPDHMLKADPSVLESAVSRYRRYPTPRFTMPLFVGIGRRDEFTAPELSFNVARAACSAGSQVTVRFYAKGTHSSTVVPSLTDVMPFVGAAMAGQPLPGDCHGLAWPGRD